MLVVCLLTAFAGLTAVTCAWTAGFVLNQLQSTDALVMLVTDGGIKSDSQSLERNLSSVTLAFKAVQDLGLALSFGCLGVAVAVGIRLYRGRQSD
jgi:long-subunit fatty acid transport protein